MEEFVDHSTIHGLQYLKAPKRWDNVQLRRSKLTFPTQIQIEIEIQNTKYKIQIQIQRNTLTCPIQERLSGVSSKQPVSSLQISPGSDPDLTRILLCFDLDLTLILPWFDPDLTLIQHCWSKIDLTLILLLRSYPERIFWLLACICAFVIGTYLIYKVIDKSITSPVLVSFDGLVNC